MMNDTAADMYSATLMATWGRAKEREFRQLLSKLAVQIGQSGQPRKSWAIDKWDRDLLKCGPRASKKEEGVYGGRVPRLHRRFYRAASAADTQGGDSNRLAAIPAGWLGQAMGRSFTRKQLCTDRVHTDRYLLVVWLASGLGDRDCRVTQSILRQSAMLWFRARHRTGVRPWNVHDRRGESWDYQNHLALV